jgi:glycine cleavage system H protein
VTKEPECGMPPAVLTCVKGGRKVKEIGELNLPDSVRYVETHEWARLEGNTVKVGITDYGQDNLGDITFVELPQLGESFEKGEQFGTVESTKAVSELFAPVGGEVSAVNADLVDTPGLINSDAYGVGWIIEIKPDRPEDVESLMNSSAYREMLKGLE